MGVVRSKPFLLYAPPRNPNGDDDKCLSIYLVQGESGRACDAIMLLETERQMCTAMFSTRCYRGPMLKSLRFDFVPQCPTLPEAGADQWNASNHYGRLHTASPSYILGLGPWVEARRATRHRPILLITASLNRPCMTDKWIYSSRNSEPKGYQQSFATLIRTMKDPVQGTSTPYSDPTVKGPKSQQLAAQLSHSLLQDYKSTPLSTLPPYDTYQQSTH